jgi:hypothetical protein
MTDEDLAFKKKQQARRYGGNGVAGWGTAGLVDTEAEKQTPCDGSSWTLPVPSASFQDSAELPFCAPPRP